METTRHFVATVYVVHDGATALHHHDKLDMWLPPGGHIDRDELPHLAAEREVEEELGMPVDLVAPEGNLESTTATSIPKPQHFLLEDIDEAADGRVVHQHVDFIYYGAVPSRDIDPAPGEQPAADWQWFGPGDLRDATYLATDIREAGLEAIRTVGDRS